MCHTRRADGPRAHARTTMESKAILEAGQELVPLTVTEMLAALRRALGTKDLGEMTDREFDAARKILAIAKELGS